MALRNRVAGDLHRRRWTTRPSRPDHPAPAGHNQGLKWKTRTDRHPTRAQIRNHAAQARSDPYRANRWIEAEQSSEHERLRLPSPVAIHT